MKLVDMRDLGSRAAMRVGSSPFRRTRRSTCSHASTPFFVPQTEPTASCRRNAPSNPTGSGESAACGRFPRGFKSRHSDQEEYLLSCKYSFFRSTNRTHGLMQAQCAVQSHRFPCGFKSRHSAHNWTPILIQWVFTIGVQFFCFFRITKTEKSLTNRDLYTSQINTRRLLCCSVCCFPSV